MKLLRALLAWWNHDIYRCRQMSVDGRVRCPGVIVLVDNMCDVCGASDV